MGLEEISADSSINRLPKNIILQEDVNSSIVEVLLQNRLFFFFFYKRSVDELVKRIYNKIGALPVALYGTRRTDGHRLAGRKAEGRKKIGEARKDKRMSEKRKEEEDGEGK